MGELGTSRLPLIQKTLAHPVPPQMKTTSRFRDGWPFFVGMAPSLTQSKSFSSKFCSGQERTRRQRAEAVKVHSLRQVGPSVLENSRIPPKN